MGKPISRDTPETEEGLYLEESNDNEETNN